tara:strand:- start:4055 stop:5179 length:1125 start_codon:yes stop_codon:yes gene_type:complete
MKNRIYKYFFYEIIRYFTVVLFALTAVIWTIQAVNFLDLVIDDGHAFKIYISYSMLTLPKILTKLIPFSFLIASIITISKLEKDNELIILWTSGLNKIHIVNLLFKISIIIMFVQLLMANIINPESLNISRSIIKNSELQFVPSLLKERQFNDTIKGVTIFVDKKNKNGEYENIFIRDEGRVLTKISKGSSTIFAKSGFVTDDEQKLVLIDGNIQKIEKSGTINIIKFQKTEINLSGLSTKTISETKIQETSTLNLVNCMRDKNKFKHNCSKNEKNLKDTKIELNKRFGMPLFIPLITLICCFLLTTRREKKIYTYNKHIYFILGFAILVASEITVRYSGLSFNHTLSYYFLPVALLPLIYLFLIRAFKYENLN